MQIHERYEHTESLDLLKSIMKRSSGSWQRLTLEGGEQESQTTRVTVFLSDTIQEIGETVEKFCAKYALQNKELELVVRMDYGLRSSWLAYSPKYPGQALTLNGYQGYEERLGYYVTSNPEALILVSFRLNDPASYEKIVLLPASQLRYRKFVIGGVERRDMGRTEMRI